MNGNIPITHLRLLQSLSFAETERLYLQSWILNVKNTAIQKDPDFRNIFKYQVRNK